MPSRDEIKPQVIEAIDQARQTSGQALQETDRLWEDLDMGPLLRKAMSKRYTKIAKKYKDGLPISMQEAEDLETVGASIDLVSRRANGDKA